MTWPSTTWTGDRLAGGTVAFSPDGRHIACTEDWDGKHVIRVFNTDDGSAAASYYGHDSVVTALDYSPDGTTIASASFDRTVRLWRT